MPGVMASSVGYTGGNTANPTYQSVCRGDGHTEALRLVFDPNQISYEELMKKVLAGASTHAAKAQYKSAVWVQNAEQAATCKRVAASMNKSAVPVLPASETKWWDAEEYHRACPAAWWPGTRACASCNPHLTVRACRALRRKIRREGPWRRWVRPRLVGRHDCSTRQPVRRPQV